MPTASITPVTGGASLPLVATAVVTNTRLPHTIGLEWPRPGISTFHATLVPFARSHCTGGAPAPTPRARSPRNDGQFAPTDTALAARTATMAKSERFVMRPGLWL